MPARVGEGRKGEGAAAFCKGGAAPSRHPGRRPTPAAFRIALALCLTVLLGGCGVEEYTYFYKPVTNEDPVLKAAPISFSHNTSNSSASFFGYDIYYMLVDADNDSMVSKCNTLDSYISGASQTPSQIIALMKSYGFKSLIGLDSSGNAMTNQPLFYISSDGLAEDIDFLVSITSLGAVSISIPGVAATDIPLYVTGPAYIRRDSKTSTGVYRDFGNLTADDVSSGGDTSYSGSVSDSERVVLFRAYIFGYGMTSSFTDVYSYPARVGLCDTDEEHSDDSIQLTGTFSD